MKKFTPFVYIFSSLLFLYLGSSFFFYLFQPLFIYHPDKLESTHQFDLPIEYEEFYLPLEQDSINSLYFSDDEKERKLILYFHGNSDNLQRWAPIATTFDSLGYDSFFIDYCGFGKSSGKAREKNLYRAGQIAYNWARQHYPPDSIVIFGRSLGTAVASKVAADNHASMLILETPFHSILDVARARYPFLNFPFQPPQTFPSYLFIPQISMPIHVFHGTKDRVTPIASSLKLKELLKVGDSFTRIENGKHKNLSNFADYTKHLHKLLRYGQEK